MANAWIEHVRQYATKHNLTYSNALKEPGCKASYKGKKSVVGSGGPLGLEDFDSFETEIRGIPIRKLARFMAKSLKEISDEGDPLLQAIRNQNMKTLIQAAIAIIEEMDEEGIDEWIQAYTEDQMHKEHLRENEGSRGETKTVELGSKGDESRGSPPTGTIPNIPHTGLPPSRRRSTDESRDTSGYNSDGTPRAGGATEGSGLQKKPHHNRFTKGSKEAKEYMALLRLKKMN